MRTESRRLLRGIAACVALALLPACSDDTPPAPGIASDQPCTRTAAFEAGLLAAGYRLDELPRLVPGATDLGLPRGAGVDTERSGYIDNAELDRVGLLGEDICDTSERHARLSGYARAYRTPVGHMAATVHLFSTAEGAQGWQRDIAEELTRPFTTLERRGGVLTASTAIGETAWKQVLFRSGALVGQVLAARRRNVAESVDVRAASRAFASLIARAPEPHTAADRYDAAALLSVPLPRDEFPESYGDLANDPSLSGCSDNREHAAKDADPADEARDLVRFRRLVGCDAAYRGDDLRTASGGSVFADERRATGYMDDAAADAERSGGGRVKRFVPDAIGDLAVGLRDSQRRETTVLFRSGRLVGTVAVRDTTGRDRTAEVTVFARRLATRVHELFEADPA